MARIRSVKPEFFRHEELYEAERASGMPLRLAFAGLWTCCDKNGVFPWRPRALKLDVLPYDELDFAAVLAALEGGEFISKFKHEGELYGIVPNFRKHQRISGKELQNPAQYPVPEGFQEPSEDEPGSDGEAPEKHPGAQERKGKERKGKECAPQVLPSDLDPIAWKNWIEYREQIRRPLKPASIPAAQRKLAAFGSDQSAVVEQSIANGWQGLFPLKNLFSPPKQPVVTAPRVRRFGE
jgi:hypothetical protein